MSENMTLVIKWGQRSGSMMSNSERTICKWKNHNLNMREIVCLSKQTHTQNWLNERKKECSSTHQCFPKDSKKKIFPFKIHKAQMAFEGYLR